MIEALVDKAIASLLSTIQGLKVVVGMGDPFPLLKTPFCVVFSNVISFEGRTPIYSLQTTIEYETISGANTVASVQNVMSSIDTVIGTQPSALVLAGLQTAGLTYLSWQAISKTQQDPGDRRKNVRELQVFAQLS